MTRKQPVAVLDQAPDGILILLRFARDEHDQVVVRTGTGDSAPQCGGQHRLDFVQVDAVAGNLDEAFGPSGDVEIAILVAAGQVAGPQDTALDVTVGEFQARLGVTEHYVGSAVHQFAGVGVDG